MQCLHDINSHQIFAKFIHIMRILHEHQSFAHPDLKESLTCLNNIHCVSGVLFFFTFDKTESSKKVMQPLTSDNALDK